MNTLLAFQRQWSDLEPELTRAFQDVGRSANYILGREVEGFERELARRCGLGGAVGVASGLDAIEIALRVLGLEAGDKVLTTPLSAFATTLAILRAGGVPVFCDVDAHGLMDLRLAEKLLFNDRSIKFVLPVHLYGFSLDLDHLIELQTRYRVRVVEDCAQSIDAAWIDRTGQVRQTGQVGALAATSFYPTKNLGCYGDGGALLGDVPELIANARRLRNYGQSAKYVHDVVGLNSRLDELHAAILRHVMLPRLAAWTERRRKLAEIYLNEINAPAVRLPDLPRNSRPGWHLFPVFVEEGGEARRDQLLHALNEQGIGGGVHYPKTIPDQAACPPSAGTWGVAARLSATELTLPIHPYITEMEALAVARSLNAVAAKRSARTG